ncbi:MAG: peptidoglycan-associated lipoprotein Pal [Gammaproteobacteria bacterium]|nr:peptidoglycan-associated lipoprotein Pal [Gammaproteobacteria bacterium]
MMTKFNLFAMAAAGLVLAGCSSTPTEEGTKTTAAPATPVVGATAASAAAPAAPAATAGSVVYFDFDRAEVKPEYMAVIKAQAARLAGNAKKVTLEGHADERGTREYNLGLGERRAKSVAEVLKANGITADRIKMVSFGEDRPAVEGHDESAWSKNRRVEFVAQ